VYEALSYLLRRALVGSRLQFSHAVQRGKDVNWREAVHRVRAAPLHLQSRGSATLRHRGLVREAVHRVRAAPLHLQSRGLVTAA
jgi:hypothetical protein